MLSIVIAINVSSPDYVLPKSTFVVPTFSEKFLKANCINKAIKGVSFVVYRVLDETHIEIYLRDEINKKDIRLFGTYQYLLMNEVYDDNHNLSTDYFKIDKVEIKEN